MLLFPFLLFFYIYTIITLHKKGHLSQISWKTMYILSSGTPDPLLPYIFLTSGAHMNFIFSYNFQYIFFVLRLRLPNFLGSCSSVSEEMYTHLSVKATTIGIPIVLKHIRTSTGSLHIRYMPPCAKRYIRKCSSSTPHQPILHIVHKMFHSWSVDFDVDKPL